MSQTSQELKAFLPGALQRFSGNRLRLNISPTERVGHTLHCALYEAGLVRRVSIGVLLFRQLPLRRTR